MVSVASQVGGRGAEDTRNTTSKAQVVSVYGIMAGSMALVMAMLAIWCSCFAAKPGIVTTPNSTYDYIIVGAGTSGCVLAGRLAALNPSRSVLLVEEGGDFGWLASMPVAAPLLQGSVANDWQYRTVPQQQSSWGLWNRTSFWPRGKGLGGTGQLNFMLHSLGVAKDYDNWRDKHGASGWDAETLMPYMKRMVSAGTCAATASEECDAESSAPKVVLESVDPKESGIASAFLEAGKVLDIQSDSVGEMEYGFLSAKHTISQGQRWSTVNGYLKPEMSRSNLHVLLNSHVSQILFSISEESTITANAIRITDEYEKEQKVITADHEIILSAGSINSAHLLLLSGVGPKEHLSDMRIPLVVDLPVGHNLFDHLNMPMYVTFESSVSITKLKLSNLRVLWDYMIHSRGYLASSGVQAVGKAPPGSGIILFGMGTTDDALRDVANFRPDTFNALFPMSHNASQEGMVVLATCLQPKSRGYVELESVFSRRHPIIDPNYLSRKEDVACTAEAYRLAVKVVQTKPFKELGAKVHFPKFRQCWHLPVDIQSDEYLECIIRTAAITGYHPGGTCSMGNSPSSVVDSDLKVKGIERLRVMDASVMPTPVSGLPNSVLAAMAERAADLINDSNS